MSWAELLLTWTASYPLPADRHVTLAPQDYCVFCGEEPTGVLRMNLLIAIASKRTPTMTSATAPAVEAVRIRSEDASIASPTTFDSPYGTDLLSII
jgi:hypothetical protein